MTTLIIPADRLDEVQPGDRLVAIDDIALSTPKVLTGGPRRLWPNGPIGIPVAYGGSTDGFLYPDSLVSRDITVERDEPVAEQDRRDPGIPIAAALSPGTYIPEEEIRPADEHGNRIAPAPPPTVFLYERERKALRRNRHYEATLRLLDDGKGGAVDLRTRVEDVNYANLPLQHSRTAGALEAFYGWVEKVGDYTWRLTSAGRRVLAALDQRKKD